MDKGELVTAIEDQIPNYKLRAHSEQISYSENWIKTPILDYSIKLDLSPELIFETLKYFIDCGERLTQMTRTYDDIDAVTRLLEEKERDLELAARIGQSLLEQNNELKFRIDQLENEITNSNETVEKLNNELLVANEWITQLKHELSNKNGLIQMYSELESEELDPRSTECKDKTSLLVSWQILHDKVVRLEEENQSLRKEASVTNKEIEFEEKKEIMLIRDCAKQITDANIQLIHLQEELTKRTEDSICQQEEITNLLTQAVEMQRACRDLNAEKEGLETALQISHECQNELSCELIELKDKYDMLLRAFHELQDEMKRKKHDSLNYINYDADDCGIPQYNFIPISESLAAEIESTLESEGYCSEFSSLTTTNFNGLSLNNQPRFKRIVCDDLEYQNQETSLLRCGSDTNNSSRQPSRQSQNIDSSLNSNLSAKFYTIPNKLKIVKPLEGSETLKKWKKLATPHLGVILEVQSGVQSKALKGIDKDLLDFAIKNEEKLSSLNVLNSEPEKSAPIPESIPAKPFESTSSIFTFTTTSLSQSNEVTIVTPSFSTLQLATGHNMPISSIDSNVSRISDENKLNLNTFKTPATPSSSPVLETNSSNINLTNFLSHFIRNTSSYFLSKNYTEANCSSKNDQKLSDTVKTVSATIADKVNDTKYVASGLAALSSFTQNTGIIVKGNLNASKPIISYSRPAVATRLEGFNALLLDSSESLKKVADSEYIGNIQCLRTLRKGGFV